jgi:hypothetical protein
MHSGSVLQTCCARVETTVAAISCVIDRIDRLVAYNSTVSGNGSSMIRMFAEWSSKLLRLWRAAAGSGIAAVSCVVGRVDRLVAYNSTVSGNGSGLIRSFAEWLCKPSCLQRAAADSGADVRPSRGGIIVIGTVTPCQRRLGRLIVGTAREAACCTVEEADADQCICKPPRPERDDPAPRGPSARIERLRSRTLRGRVEAQPHAAQASPMPILRCRSSCARRSLGFAYRPLGAASRKAIVSAIAGATSVNASRRPAARGPLHSTLLRCLPGRNGFPVVANRSGLVTSCPCTRFGTSLACAGAE